MKINKIFLLPIFIFSIISFLRIISAFSLDETAPQSVLLFTNFLNFGVAWRGIILGIIISVIVFVAMFDILEFIPFFKNSLIKIISCVFIVFLIAYFNWTNQIISLLISFAATFGAIGVTGLIILFIIIFIGLSWVSFPLAKLAAKLKRY